MIKDLKVVHPETKDGRYPGQDTPKHLASIQKQAKVKPPRQARSDIQLGQVVVALEGPYASSRVVVVKKCNDFTVVCCGPEGINNIPFFRIDERFLLSTSTVLPNISGEKIGDSDVLIVGAEDVDFTPSETTDEMRKVSGKIEEEVSKIKNMKRYLATPFSMPEGKDFYTLNF